MKYTPLTLCLAGALAACHNAPPPPVFKDTVAVAPTTKRPVRDTAFISGSCVVLYSMNDKKTSLVKKEYKNEQDFEDAMDDSYYYLANARDTLEKSKVRTIDTTGEQLYFKGRDGHTFALHLHARAHVVEAYIFDGLHAPVNADLTDVMADYLQVMKGQ